MNEPTIDQTPGSLSFTWADSCLQILVTRYSNKKDSGEMKILHLNGDGARAQLMFTRFDFMSHDRKDKTIKQLNSKYPDYEWEQIIEKVSLETVRLMREGEPMQLIDSTGEIRRMEYLAYPLLPINEPTVLFGDGEAGKSLIGQLLYVLVTSPGARNDEVLSKIGLRLQEEPCIGGYLDYERGYNIMDYRYKALCKGMRIWPPPMQWRRCSVPLADDIEAVHKFIGDHDIDFLVIDSLGVACGSDLNGPEAAIRFFSAIRSLNVTVLVLAHNSKGEGTKTIYGSTFFQTLASAIWQQRGQYDTDTDTVSAALQNTKNNIGPRFKDIGFKAYFDDPNMTIRIERNDEAAKNVLPETQPEEAMRILAGGSAHYTKVAAEMGIASKNANTVLDRLVKQEKVTRLGKGMYGLRFAGDE